MSAIEQYVGEFRWVGVMRERWGSICSTHRDYVESCPRCRVGRYANCIQSAAEESLFKRSPEEWRRFANDPNRRSRRFLEEVFPGLKP